MLPFCGARMRAHPSPLNLHDLPNKRLMEQHLENTWVTCKTLHPLQLGAAVDMYLAAAWRRCFVKALVSIVVGVSRIRGVLRV
jgi:hypothetical protein